MVLLEMLQDCGMVDVKTKSEVDALADMLCHALKLIFYLGWESWQDGKICIAQGTRNFKPIDRQNQRLNKVSKIKQEKACSIEH